MTFNWQEITAASLVLAAVGYLIYVSWKSIPAKRSGGCGPCSCPSKDADKEESLVTLDPDPTRPKGGNMKAQGNALGTHEEVKPKP